MVNLRLIPLILLILLVILVSMIPQQGLGYSVDIWVSGGCGSSFYVGEEFKIYFYVSHRSYVRVISCYSNGSRVVYQGYVDSGRYHINTRAAEPAGMRALWLVMYVNGWPVAWDLCTINILPPYYREKALPVMRIRQPGDDCWAAVLAMTVCYYLRCSPEMGRSVASYIHDKLQASFPEGIDDDYFYQAEKGLKNRYGLRLDLDPMYRLTWDDVKKEIDNNRSLIAFIQFYDPYYRSWIAHAVVIARYKESPLTRKALIVDPSEWFPIRLGKRECRRGLSGSWCDWELITDMLGVDQVFQYNLMKGVRVILKG